MELFIIWIGAFILLSLGIICVYCLIEFMVGGW